MMTPSTEPAPEVSRSTPVEPSGRAITRRLGLHFALVLLGSAALGAFIAGVRGALSAALGVLLAAANLLLMRRITSALAAAGGASAAWGIALPFKLVALVGIAYGLVDSGVAQPVPLAMGFALLPLTGVFLPRGTSVPGLVPQTRSTPRPRRPPPVSAVIPKP